MKLYSSINCNTQVQLNGCTSWCLILEGCEEEIEQTFNGLYNLKGVGKRATLDWCNDSKTLACVWTNEEQMFTFFVNQFQLKHMMHMGKNKFTQRKVQKSIRCFRFAAGVQTVTETVFTPNKQLDRYSTLYAQNCIAQLRSDTRQLVIIRNFNPCWDNDADVCDVSQASAEKPDTDMKDAILNHSLQDRTSVREVERMIGAQ